MDKMDKRPVSNFQAARPSAAIGGKVIGRPTHFVALRIDSPEVMTAVEQLQKKLVMSNRRFKEWLIPPEKLHLTIFILSLPVRADVARANSARQCLRSLDDVITKYYSRGGPTLNFTGVGHFHSRVLWLDLEPGDERTQLELFARAVQDHFVAAKVLEKAMPFTPHVTIMKGAPNELRIERRIIDEVASIPCGRNYCASLYLNVITEDELGGYNVEAQIPFPVYSAPEKKDEGEREL